MKTEAEILKFIAVLIEQPKSRWTSTIINALEWTLEE